MSGSISAANGVELCVARFKISVYSTVMRSVMSAGESLMAVTSGNLQSKVAALGRTAGPNGSSALMRRGARM